MRRRARIRTMLYGDQSILPFELDLLHTPTLQRLYDLHQLGLADRVYIDASHARLHHVVGVLAQVDTLVVATAANLRRRPDRTFEIGVDGEQHYRSEDLADHVRRTRPIARLIGLLHDITHAPFGHTVEDEIQLFASKHDEPDRQQRVFYRLLCEYLWWLGRDAGCAKYGVSMPDALASFVQGAEGEQPPEPACVAQYAGELLTRLPVEVTAAAWLLSPAEIAHHLDELDVAMTALLHLALLHNERIQSRHIPSEEPYLFQTAIRAARSAGQLDGPRQVPSFNPHRDAYLLDLVGNTVCADILDYAKRDARFANLKLDYDAERIAENFTLVRWDPERYGPDIILHGERSFPEGFRNPFEGFSLRAAISLFSHKFRSDVPSELMNLLNVRFYLFERAVYHPTKAAAGAMLGTALQLMGWRRPSESTGTADRLPAELQYAGDAVFLHDLRYAAKLALRALHASNDRPDPRVGPELV